MDVLNDGRATGQVLAERLRTTPQNVSKHLGVLYQAGIVSRRREANWVYYELVDWTSLWLVEQVGKDLIAGAGRSGPRYSGA